MGYIGDNTGDNISLRNPNYCELTGLYWAWKNLKCDYIDYAIIEDILLIVIYLKRLQIKIIKWI